MGVVKACAVSGMIFGVMHIVNVFSGVGIQDVVLQTVQGQDSASAGGLVGCDRGDCCFCGWKAIRVPSPCMKNLKAPYSRGISSCEVRVFDLTFAR